MSDMSRDPSALVAPGAAAQPSKPVAARGARAWWQAAAGEVPAWAGILLAVALWLIARPYRGVRHDGILYLGQTLGRMMPDQIGRDLFLVYGSQDKYSLFSHLMAPLVRLLGVGPSQMTMLLASEVLFLAACWLLTRDLPERFLRWCAMLALAAVAHTYGGLGAFSFAEPFLTARVLAEPFALFALVLLMQGRLALALLSIVTAIAFHPLIALPALATGWLVLVLGDRRWLWALAALAAAVAAGVAGIAPFDGLLHGFDPQWRAAVDYANQNAFVSSGDSRDWASVAFDIGVLFLALRALAGGPLARLIRAILGCTLIFTVLWGVGADLLHNVLLTQLQLWRALWLAHLFALLTLPMVLLHAWRDGPIGRWCAVALALAAVAVGANWNTGWLCVAWAAAAFLVEIRRVPLSPFIARLAVAVSCLAIVVVSAAVAYKTFDAVREHADRFNGVGIAQVVMGLTACCALVGVVVLQGLRQGGVRRAVAAAATLGLLAWGAASWDQRSDWQRYVENGFEVADAPFADRIPAGAVVYWDNSLLDAWMLAHRPNYFSPEQSSGLLFSRPTAIEYMRRREDFLPLGFEQEVCATIGSLMGGPSDRAACLPKPETLAALCRIPGGPDFLIFEARDAQGATATWTFRPRDPAQSRSFNLYDCAKLR